VTARVLAPLRRWLDAPQPIERLAFLRIVVPLATLGFLSSRLLHADHWLSDRAFHVPCLGPDDWRQVACLPAVPVSVAWAIAIAATLAGVAVAVGLCTRVATLSFASLVAYLVLADRLEAFTVTKIAPVLGSRSVARACPRCSCASECTR
jgi:hypothetical protein